MIWWKRGSLHSAMRSITACAKSLTSSWAIVGLLGAAAVREGAAAAKVMGFDCHDRRGRSQSGPTLSRARRGRRRARRGPTLQMRRPCYIDRVPAVKEAP
ncbi:hypothetical protein GCM10028813_12880 [Ramlibacter alkalitolerans]